MFKLELSLSPDGFSESGEIQKTEAWHSNLFSKYFSCYRQDKINISYPDDLKFQVSKGDWGRSGRYGHFEVRLNGVLCTVCIGDNPYISPTHYHKSKAKISFVSQLNNEDIKAIKGLYERDGHRVYPIPLPLYWHAEEITSGRFEYECGKKEFTSNMSFGFRGRATRLPWFRVAKRHPKEFSIKKLPSEDFLSFSVNKQLWGVNLKGHGRGRKCYRESEYMCMGVPLALNYKPIYPFPFEPDVHYIYLRRKEDILKLKDIDPEPFAKISKEIGNKYIKHEGFLDLMLRCIEQKEYNPFLGEE
jgi:hypothetical protein